MIGSEGLTWDEKTIVNARPRQSADESTRRMRIESCMLKLETTIGANASGVARGVGVDMMCEVVGWW